MAVKKRRVAITGLGAVTPVGHTLDATWNGIVAGACPAAPVQAFDASQFPCKFAYEVRDFRFDTTQIPEAARRYLNRAGQFGCQAALEAMTQAGLPVVTAPAAGAIDPERLAVCLGVGVGSPDLAWYANVFLPGKLATDELTLYHRRHYPAALTAVVAGLLGARGGNTTVHTACASSGQALGEAYEMIASGEMDVVLTGGADSMVNPFQMAGFCLLGALSQRNDDPQHASRPFDTDRDGFVLGEGACMFVFENFDRARQRGAKILGEICGYGVTESAYRITDLHPEGRGTMEAMQQALADAGIAPGEVGYLNAHGTSTLLNDRIESLAISKVFADAARLAVSSTKSMTGHLIAAAGALEFAVCVKALRHKIVPPARNLFHQDPTCAITLAPGEPSPLACAYALSNSIGFGGSNTSLIARRV